jgi:hypothetical protein
MRAAAAVAVPSALGVGALLGAGAPEGHATQAKATAAAAPGEVAVV